MHSDSTLIFLKKLHFNLKPFYDLLHENPQWKWTEEHEAFFQQPTQDQKSKIHYSWCFTYCIRCCPFPTKWRNWLELKLNIYLLLCTYTRIPKHDSSFNTDNTLMKNFFNHEQSKSMSTQNSTAAIDVQPKLPFETHCSQIVPFFDTSFFM